MFIDKYSQDEMVGAAKYELEHLGQDVDSLPIFKEMADSTGTEGKGSLQ